MGATNKDAGAGGCIATPAYPVPVKSTNAKELGADKAAAAAKLDSPDGNSAPAPPKAAAPATTDTTAAPVAKATPAAKAAPEAPAAPAATLI